MSEPRQANTKPMKAMENTMRQAATESAGAEARRTSGPAHETASTATTSASQGDTLGAGTPREAAVEAAPERESGVEATR